MAHQACHRPCCGKRPCRRGVSAEHPRSHRIRAGNAAEAGHSIGAGSGSGATSGEAMWHRGRPCGIDADQRGKPWHRRRPHHRRRPCHRRRAPSNRALQPRHHVRPRGPQAMPAQTRDSADLFRSEACKTERPCLFKHIQHLCRSADVIDPPRSPCGQATMRLRVERPRYLGRSRSSRSSG